MTYTSPLAKGGTLLFTNGTSARVFDGIMGNGTSTPQMTRFVPNAVNFNVRNNTTNGIGGQVEITLGSDANVINSYGYPTNTYTDLTQAYLYYTNGPFTLDLGKFETLAGYEVIESPNDNNISRSILFGYAVPFTHTGARLVYAPTSKIALTTGANFGWDQIIGTHGLSTVEGAVAWTPSSVFSLSTDVYSGSEPAVTGAGTPVGTRTLVDVVGHWNPSSKWNFGLNYDSATQTNTTLFDATGTAVATGSVNWNGLAGYAVYNLNSNFSLAGRLEGFDDANGSRTGIAQVWDEATGTLQYAVGHLKLRAELRYDWSNQSVFARYTSPVGTSTTNNATAALEAIYTLP